MYEYETAYITKVIVSCPKKRCDGDGEVQLDLDVRPVPYYSYDNNPGEAYATADFVCSKCGHKAFVELSQY